MKVSVIIPAFNEERFLFKTIAAVKANDFPKDDYEIIVVNNGSADRTPEIAIRAGVKLIDCDRRFVGAARNLGAKHAGGAILAFLDADCIPAKDWLREGVNSLKKEPCVSGAECGIPDEAVWIEKVWFSQKKLGRFEVSHINSGNFFINKQLFLELGGFDDDLSSGEDYEFCIRANLRTKIIADSKIRVVHLGNPKTLREFLKREMWHGIGALSSVRHNWFDKPFIGTLIFSFFVICQFVGFTIYLFTWELGILVIGTSGIVFIVTLTAAYRVALGSPVRNSAALSLLYLTYYLGRMIALGMTIIGLGDHQRTR